jgi:hypothetical protein
VRRRPYFFLPAAKVGCHPAAFWLGAAAIVLIFSFLGFLTSIALLLTFGHANSLRFDGDAMFE